MDEQNENAKSVESGSKIKRLVLLALVASLCLLIAWIVHFVTVKPKVTVDYLAEYNKLTCPQGVDPYDNAALYYQRATNAYVEMPDAVRELDPWGDIDAAAKERLRLWFNRNLQAFPPISQAAEKRSYWIERTSPDDSLGRMTCPELDAERDLADLLMWNAKFHAAEGQYRQAVWKLMACYYLGRHKCNPDLLLMDQFSGLYIKNQVLANAFFILSRYPVDNETLKVFGKKLSALRNEEHYLPSLQGEKLLAYEALQSRFVDNGRGSGRWAWSNGAVVERYLNDESDFHRKYRVTKERLYYCLLGPTRNDMAAQIEESASLADRVIARAPWQLQEEESNCISRIDEINISHLFLALPIDCRTVYHAYYSNKAKTDALIVVLAILQHRKERDALPESLDALVAAGYLESVPNDPFTGKQLVYKLTKDDFTLYSAGRNRLDDGGVIEVEFLEQRDLSVNIEMDDHVYWPIKIVEPKPFEIPGPEPADPNGMVPF